MKKLLLLLAITFMALSCDKDEPDCECYSIRYTETIKDDVVQRNILHTVKINCSDEEKYKISEDTFEEIICNDY